MVGADLALVKREDKQFPPENDANPVLYAWSEKPGTHIRAVSSIGQVPADALWWREYWAKPRVLDTFSDSRDYVVGSVIARPFVFGAGIALGIWIAGRLL